MFLHGCIVRLNLHFTLSYRFGKSMKGSGEEKMNQCSVCEYNKESENSSIFVSLKEWQCSMQTDWNSLIPKFLIPFFFFSLLYSNLMSSFRYRGENKKTRKEYYLKLLDVAQSKLCIPTHLCIKSLISAVLRGPQVPETLPSHQQIK